MSVFRSCIRKFLEKRVYCENAVSINCAVIFVIAQSSLNGFLKLGAGKLLMLLTELSDCEVWQKSLVENSETIFCCEEIGLSLKSEWANGFVTTPIAMQ